MILAILAHLNEIKRTFNVILLIQEQDLGPSYLWSILRAILNHLKLPSLKVPKSSPDEFFNNNFLQTLPHLSGTIFEDFFSEDSFISSVFPLFY